MPEPTALFFILLAAGLLLIGAELFVPGGVLGVTGALALLGAAISAFASNELNEYAPLISLGILFMSVASLVLWIKIFPRTRLGKTMSAMTDLDDAHASNDNLKDLLDMKGFAVSDLRPSGFAKIDSKRVDVVTRGEMIEKGKEVRVIEVEGNRVVVKAV